MADSGIGQLTMGPCAERFQSGLIFASCYCHLVCVTLVVVTGLAEVGQAT